MRPKRVLLPLRNPLRQKQLSTKEALLWGSFQLKDLGKTEARLSAERLLEEVLGCERVVLYLEPEKLLSSAAARSFCRLIAQRKKRIPLDYLLGRTHFWNEILQVGPGCLIPRPSTEVLVEKFIEKSGFESKDSFHFLDLGCGSGAIGISLLRHFPRADAVFADISKDALAVTRKNLKRYDLLSRSRLVQSDLFENLRPKNPWEVILSNPPYLSARDLKIAQPEVLKEPWVALSGGKDGLEAYRVIAEEAPVYLKKNGLLVLEMGKGQAASVKKFCSKSFSNIEIYKDYASIDRVLMARKNK